jgi:hypothetical protein
MKVDPLAAGELAVRDRSGFGVERVHARGKNSPLTGHSPRLKLFVELDDIGGGHPNESISILENQVDDLGGDLSFSGLIPRARGITERCTENPAAGELDRQNEACHLDRLAASAPHPPRLPSTCRQSCRRGRPCRRPRPASPALKTRKWPLRSAPQQPRMSTICGCPSYDVPPRVSIMGHLPVEPVSNSFPGGNKDFLFVKAGRYDWTC